MDKGLKPGVFPALIFLSLIIFSAQTLTFAAELKPLTVAGFVNTGDEKNDNANLVITKTFIGFFLKMTRDVTPYRDVANRALETGFWKKKKMDKDDAVSVAQPFNTKLVLCGDYSVNDARETVTLNVYVIDVVTGDQIVRKSFTGKAGDMLADTANTAVRETAGAIVGRKIEMGALKVTVLPESRIYKLYINGVYVSDISRSAGFQEDYIVGQNLDISLRNSSDKEVYEKTVVVEKNKTSGFEYQPVGILHVKVLDANNGEVFVDGKNSGKLDANGELTVSGLPADVPHVVLVKSGKDIVGQENLVIREGEVRAVALGGSDAKRSIFFPIKAGMTGLFTGTYMSGGVDWYFLDSIHAFGSGGVILYNNTNLGFGIVPIAEAGVGYTYSLDKLWKVGASASCMAMFSAQIIWSPAVNLELDYWRFFLNGGIRYSFTTNGGLNAVFAFGFRI